MKRLIHTALAAIVAVSCTCSAVSANVVFDEVTMEVQTPDKAENITFKKYVPAKPADRNTASEVDYSKVTAQITLKDGSPSSQVDILDTLVAKLDGADEQASYQWQGCTDGVNWAVIPGATTNEYWINYENKNSYIRCVIKVGRLTFKSDAVVIPIREMTAPSSEGGETTQQLPIEQQNSNPDYIFRLEGKGFVMLDDYANTEATFYITTTDAYGDAINSSQSSKEGVPTGKAVSAHGIYTAASDGSSMAQMLTSYGNSYSFFGEKEDKDKSYASTALAAFDDVAENHPYSEAINLLNTMNVAKGDGNGKFYPEQFVTRAEFVTLAVAAFSIKGESKHSFKDVPASAYYTDAVGKAVNAGIIRGKSADKFDPDAGVTHQEAAAILVNAYEKTRDVMIPITDAVESFKDADMVSAWALTGMDKAATYRFVPVGSKDMLRPVNGVTRGEAAQLISNVLLTLGERRTDDYTSPTTFIQTKNGNIFLRSEKADIGVKTGVRIFGWEVRGYYGDILKKGYEKTQNGEATLNFDDLDLGHYSLKVFATDENGIKHDLAETFFAIIDDYDFMQISYDESPFGMNTSYYLYYMGWSPEYTHEMVYNSGARNIRDGCSWRTFEKGRGEYVLFQPGTIETFKQYGMTQLYSAGYNHPLYDDGNAPYTAEGIQAFADYVKAVFELHDGYVQYLDVHNEWWAPNFCKGPANCSPVIYAQLAKATWETVKPSYPDSKLGLVVGDSSTYRDWTEELFNAGALEHADYLQYHTYTRNPEVDLKADAEFFREMMEKYGNGKEVGIWLTETGGHTAAEANGLTMKEKANLIPRQHVVSFANGIEKVYNYNLMNDGVNPADNEHNFGLVYNLSSVYGALVPKEAYVSYAVMTRQLTGLEFKETKRADNIHHYVFANDEKKVETLYSLEDTTVTLITDKPVKATDIMGIENTYYPLDGRIYLDLCPEMLYLEGDFTVSEEAIPLQLYVKNAVVGSETQFDFEAFNELENKNITGRVYKDTFNVADDYYFKAPTEVGEKTYIVDLEASGEPFARLRQVVDFTNAYALDAVAGFEASQSKVDGTMTISLTNHANTDFGIDGIKYTILGEEGTFDITDTVGPLRTGTWEVKLPEVIPGRMYDISLRLIRDGELSQKIDFSGRYHYDRLYRGELPIGATTDIHKANALHVEKGALDVVRMGGVGLDDDKDISAELWVAYDDDYLYIRGEVTDDALGNVKTGPNIWEGDCMQVAVSTEEYAKGTNLRMLWELGFALIESGKASWCWTNQIGASATYADEMIPGLEYDVTRDDDANLTLYEVKIPWSGVPGFKPSRSNPLRLTVVFNEGDESGSRDGWITWGAGLAEGKNITKLNKLEILD